MFCVLVVVVVYAYIERKKAANILLCILKMNILSCFFFMFWMIKFPFHFFGQNLEYIVIVDFLFEYLHSCRMEKFATKFFSLWLGRSVCFHSVCDLVLSRHRRRGQSCWRSHQPKAHDHDWFSFRDRYADFFMHHYLHLIHRNRWMGGDCF